LGSSEIKKKAEELKVEGGEEVQGHLRRKTQRKKEKKKKKKKKKRMID